MHEKKSEQMLVVNVKGCGHVVFIYPETAEVAKAVKNQMTSVHCTGGYKYGFRRLTFPYCEEYCSRRRSVLVSTGFL